VRVVVRGVDVNLVGARRSDVGLLLRPPVLPLVFGLFLAALAFALRARARSHALASTPRDAAWAGVCRVGAAALLLEASLLLLGAYRIYL
jgi:hypothetical protein